MSEISPEDLQEGTATPQETTAAEKAEAGVPESGQEEEQRPAYANSREASYVVLFIAAVFIINAMETGSYRTPWPVAIVTLLAGLGLFGYSWHLKTRSGT